MRRGITKFLASLVIAYALVVAILWAFQERFIYPAPRHEVELPEGFEIASLKTGDGLVLRSFARSASGQKPTVVYFHGNGSSLAGALSATRRLQESGYGLLLVEYRGYGGNPGEPGEQGFYRDGRAAMDWLAERGISPGQTVLASNSIGSGTAVQLASEFRPCALMLTAPFTSLADAAVHAMPYIPVGPLLRDRYENEAKIAELDLPVFIMHGTADRVVPFALGKRLSEAAPDATFIAFEGAGHELAFRGEAKQAQLDWIDQLVASGACK